MKNNIRRTTTLALTLNCYMLFSQSIDTTLLSINDTIHHFYVFKKNINLTSTQFISNSIYSAKLSENNKFSLLSERIDSLKNKHQKFQQQINGVPIEFSKIIFHSDKNNRLNHINGIIENNIGNINTTPLITSIDAINSAISNSKKKDFVWLDERSLGQSYPIAELVITKHNIKLYNVPENYILAYKLPINYSDGNALFYYVNAQTGTVIKTANGTDDCIKADKKRDVAPNTINSNNIPSNALPICSEADCVTGTANTNYYGSQYIFTQYFTNSLFVCTHRLKETCSGTYIYVTDNGTDFHDGTNNWVTTNDLKGTTAFFSLSWANRFWNTYLGRNSFDNNFHQVSADLHTSYSTNFNRTTKKIQVGKHSNGNWFGSLDIMGHEYAHGVTYTEAQLDGTGESGALNEGISDIFGALTEHWTAKYKNIGRSPNYEHGEDVVTGCDVSRSLSNPENYCCANTYMAGSNWRDPNPIGGATSANDYGGKHYNCGVIGKWFYLLAEGGSNTNDLGNQYCVKGIGQDDASWIVYEALRNYVSTNTNFNDFRFYTEYVAFQYYGFSPQYAAVQQAWYAVGLDNDVYTIGIPINIFGKTETTNKNYNYNSRIQVYDYVTNPSTVIDMSSNESISFFNESPPQTLGAIPKDIYIKAGSEFHAYISPACAGGARLGNVNQNSDTETIQNQFEWLEEH